MRSVIINFSGHSLCGETESILKEKYDQVIDVPPYDFDFGGNVETQLKGLIENLTCKVDGTTSLTIIPPGQSTFSILLVSYIHGLTGHFPKICYLELGDVGLYFPKVEYDIDAQKIRSAGRKFRNYVYGT